MLYIRGLLEDGTSVPGTGRTQKTLIIIKRVNDSFRGLTGVLF